jgi:hypothetical protein
MSEAGSFSERSSSGNHRSWHGDRRGDAVDRLATQCGTFDQHVLIFLIRPEEDVVDPLVD